MNVSYSLLDLCDGLVVLDLWNLISRPTSGKAPAGLGLLLICSARFDSMNYFPLKFLRLR